MVVAHKLSLPPVIPYYISTVQVLVSVVHERNRVILTQFYVSVGFLSHTTDFFAIGPSSQVCLPYYRKVVMETLLLSRDCVTDITSVSVPENDLESDLVKLNANDSAYYCSISNILRYNYP